MKMNLDSRARYIYDMNGRKIEDISEGKWQIFCNSCDTILKEIYRIFPFKPFIEKKNQ